MRSPRIWLIAAMIFGLIHAGFSIYWGFGGSALLDTVGQQMASELSEARWVLVAVGVTKGICAVMPVLLFSTGHAASPAWWWTCAVGAGVLLMWGGAGCVVAHLVLTGVVRSPEGIDYLGQLGHAWLWDPLFVLWGLFLTVGLLRLRPRRRVG